MQHITYPLNNGFIESWLVAGPHVHVVENLEQFQGPDYKQQLVRAAYTQETGLNGQLPCEQAELHVNDITLHWQLYRCQPDHFVDLTGFYHLTSHLRSWAYAELMLPQAGPARLELTTNAPADLWLNNQHIGHVNHFQHQIPLTVSFDATLSAGANRLLVRFEAIAARECPYVMALRVVPTQGLRTEQIAVQLPVEHAYQELRTILEQIYDWAIVDQDVFTAGETLAVRWPDSLPEKARQEIMVRLVDARGRIYIEALHRVMPGSRQSFGDVTQYPEGSYSVLLMPHPTAYYERSLRIIRAIPLTILKNTYTSIPDATDDQRYQQALLDAAQRDSFYGQIAHMQLGNWQAIKWNIVEETIVGIEQRRDCSDFYLVGLLGALIRYGDNAAFPPEMVERIRSCALGFRYWAHDPGADAMWFWSENHQILFHACEILAAQHFSNQLFSNTGQTASWHLERGEAFALEWLRKRAAGGFREWDSNCYFEHDVLALTHIADLSDNDQLAELASVILDKLFFSMALNSFKGVFGSTHGRSYTPHIKGARQELTSGIGRMLWGMGVFNEHVLGSVALACATSYKLPTVIAEIAMAQPEELWSKERHRQELTWDYDRSADLLDINKVTYRTPDFMLCSAQDHQAGQPGVQQHLWQATLSQDAVVFVTHPPCFSEESSHRPNFWHGHVTLPRVAQWHGTVIDIRNIPHDDWLGFTHAYFPTYAFDEYMLRDGWAFARVGEAYLAITATAGISLITQGNNAYRELRSNGYQNAWICRMGRAARDGDFRAFQRDVLGLAIRFEDMRLLLETLDGSSLSFGWEGPLLVDAVEQPLSGFKHYDSPICSCELGAASMAIAGWEQVLRLSFES